MLSGAPSATRLAALSRSTIAALPSQPAPEGHPLTEGGRNSVWPVRSNDPWAHSGTGPVPATRSTPTTNSTGLFTSVR